MLDGRALLLAGGVKPLERLLLPNGHPSITEHAALLGRSPCELPDVFSQVVKQMVTSCLRSIFINDFLSKVIASLS
jgi:hypothetical protein